MAELSHDKMLWITHGAVCGATNDRAQTAERARIDAGIALASAAAALAESLKTAKEAYLRTDEEQKQILDDQMRSE